MIGHLEGGAHDQVWIVLSGLKELELRGSRSFWGEPKRHEALLLQEPIEIIVCQE